MLAEHAEINIGSLEHLAVQLAERLTLWPFTALARV